MKKNKGLILFVLAVIMFLSTVVYADVLSEPVLIENAEDIPKISGINSEIKYGPFSTGYVEPEISDEIISLYSTETADIAYNYGELRDAITKHMRNYENSFTINYKGNTSTLKADIENMWNEIFETDNYIYGTVNTYGEYSYIPVPNDVVINFTSFTYHTNKTQEQFVDAEVVSVANEIIIAGMSDFQKVKAINDWIVNNTKYSFTASTSIHAAYTLFNEGKGVCQAYALAAYRLLEEAGLEVKYVTGDAQSKDEKVAHAWNLVKVDGNWYHLDTTWNDPLSATEDILSYKYFLISDAAIGLDHFMDDRTYPEATNTKYEVMREIADPVELDNSLFYIKYVDSYSYKLWKLNLDTLEEIKITDDNVQYIAGYGDFIYYSNYSRGGHIYKVNIDGTENEKLNSVHSTNLRIEFPNLHFYDETNNKWDKITIGELINVTGISLNRTKDINLTVGGQAIKLEATVTPEDATNKAITWTSSDSSVATVKDGLVTAIKAGTTTITASTLDGNFISSVDIKVKDGYKILAKNEKEIDPKHTWTIKLSKGVKEETANLNSVYIENEFGDRLGENDIEINVSKEDPTLINISIKSQYEKNKVYYVVVENTLLSSEENETLKEAVKMPFIIK